MTIDFVLTCKDPSEPVSRLYGEYTFWLLHHNGTEEWGNVPRVEELLTKQGFNQWGLSLKGASLERYRELCSIHSRIPEVGPIHP